jgi:hypothetical protein
LKVGAHVRGRGWSPTAPSLQIEIEKSQFFYTRRYQMYPPVKIVHLNRLHYNNKEIKNLSFDELKETKEVINCDLNYHSYITQQSGCKYVTLEL